MAIKVTPCAGPPPSLAALRTRTTGCGRARNWEEFRKALKQVWGPAQNAVYADITGNIGYVMGARVPIRKKGTAKFPFPAIPMNMNGRDTFPSSNCRRR